MNKLIRKDDALAKEVFSRDLREYVVPSREIKRLREYDEPTEQAEDVEKMLQALFNRCRTLTHGAMCIFCGIRDACDMRRSVFRHKSDILGKTGFLEIDESVADVKGENTL